MDGLISKRNIFRADLHNEGTFLWKIAKSMKINL